MSFKTQNIQVDGSINVGGTIYLSGVPLPSDTTSEKVNRSGDTMTGGLLISAGDISIMNGDAFFNRHVHVAGYLQVDGSLIYTNIQSISVSTGFIQLNTGLTGSPSPTLQSGIIVNRGTSDPYIFVYDEDGQNFRIGIATVSTSTHYNDASTQAVATRQDSPASSGIGYWNSNKFRIDTSPGFTYNPATGDVSIIGSLRASNNIYLPVGGNLWIGNANDSSARTRLHTSGLNSYMDFGNQLYIRGGLIASNYIMTCTSSGKVGIGTQDPISKLDILSSGSGGPPSGTTPVEGIVVGATITSGVLNLGVDAVGSFYSWIQSRGNASAVYYDLALNPQGGNVGIGNVGVSNTKLAVTGADAGSSNYGLVVKNSAAANLLSLRNDGLVTSPGILTVSPAYTSMDSILSDGDFNNKCGWTNTALPPGVDFGGYLTIGSKQDRYGGQIVVNYTSSELWFRNINNGATNGWNKVANTASPSFTGAASFDTAKVIIQHSGGPYGVGIKTTATGGGTWSRRFGIIKDSDSALIGGFGALGDPNVVTHYWIGRDYNDYGLVVYPDAQVELNYDNSKKFETQSGGVYTTGTCNASSTMTATNFILSSDIHSKQNIGSIDKSSIDVEYKEFELISEPGQKRYGVIAQDLQKTHPELVRSDKETGLLSVAYIDLLIKEVASLKERVTELERKK